MTTNDAIDLARTTFEKFGYKTSDFQMDGPPTSLELAGNSVARPAVDAIEVVYLLVKRLEILLFYSAILDRNPLILQALNRAVADEFIEPLNALLMNPQPTAAHN